MPEESTNYTIGDIESEDSDPESKSKSKFGLSDSKGISLIFRSQTSSS
ncbi:14985_t:CDS:2 [Funneliformis mosseae]|uniref:14985_t:CDS:1 n=1 Tax=Funneliformis mosseae TaxID=27381 RepID=A0A9N9FKQ6_FUNMO|nr:14985_t:CDS:2 [Funneliformis mosseae]